jgi:hypothetical protein
MGGNTPEDERRFATAARVSEINLSAYRNFVQPWLRTMVTPQMAEWIRNLHPLRLQYEMFSSANPFMAVVEKSAEKARDERKPAAGANPFLGAQEKASKQIVGALDAWRDSQEALSEAVFLAVYGSPALQAAVGVDPNSAPSRKLEMSPQHRELLQKRIAELKSRISQGGLREGVIRGLLYVGMTRGMVDERSLEALRRARGSDSGPRMTLAEFKAMVREQFFMLLLDQDAALAAIPKLLPESEEKRRVGFAVIPDVLSASAKISGETAKRLNEIGRLFGIDTGEMPESRTVPFNPQAKAS